MALNFPTGQEPGYSFTGDNGITYTYDGVKWLANVAGGAGGGAVSQLENNGYQVKLQANGVLSFPYSHTIGTGEGDMMIQSPGGVILGTDGSSGSVTSIGISNQAINLSTQRQGWYFNNVGFQLGSGGILANDPGPATITLTGSDHSACDGTYTRTDYDVYPPTWFKDADAGSAQTIRFENNGWVAVTTDINTTAIYVNTGSIRAPLAQWDLGYSGGPAPTSTCTYSSAHWNFSNTGVLYTPGNLVIPDANGIFYSNGDPYSSGGGSGTYANADVAAYLLNFDGSIEFTSSTATIANVDTITVLDHIRSPAYQFANGVSILNGLATIVGNVGGDAALGALWFNTEDSRTYVRAGGYWVDANPPVSPAPSFYTGNLEFSDTTIISDTKAWTFGTDGNLSLPQGVAFIATQFDPEYIGDYDNSVVVSNNGLSVEAVSPTPNTWLTTALLNTPILEGEKKMFSIYIDRMSNNRGGYNGIGIATHSATLTTYIGDDNGTGVGFYEQGSYYGNNRGYGNPEGFTTGDIIDIAVDNAGFNIWMRRNGGYWNNRSDADPATNAYGYETGEYGTVYPGVTPYFENADIGNKFTLQTTPTYSVPAGFEFYGAESYESAYIKFGNNSLTVDHTGNLLVNGNLVTGSGGGSTGTDRGVIYTAPGIGGLAFANVGGPTLGSLSVAGDAYMTAATTSGFTATVTGRNRLVLTNGDSTLSAGNDIYLTANLESTAQSWKFGSNGSLGLPTSGQVINNGSTWTFGSDGILTVPQTIVVKAGDATQAIAFSADSGSSRLGYIMMDSGGNMVNSVGGYSVKINGNDRFAVTGTDTTVMGGNDLYLKSNKNTAEHVMKLDTAGNLIIPGNINFANGTNILSSIPSIGNITFSDTEISGTGSNVTLTADTTDWTFYANGNLTLPAGGDILDNTGTSILDRLSVAGSSAVLTKDQYNTSRLKFTGNATIETAGYLTGTGGLALVDSSSQQYVIVKSDRVQINTGFPDQGTGLQSYNEWQFLKSGVFKLPTTGIIENNGKQWKFAANGTTTFPDHMPVSITGNLTVGNLTVNGNTTIINTESYTVVDNIIQIATDNPADTLDIGFVGHRTVGGILQHTGLVRDASTGIWELFSNVTTQPGTTVDFTQALLDDLQLDKLYADTVHLSGTPPSTVAGAAGDLAGDIHIDSNYLYYCTTNWTASSYTVGWDGATSNTIFLVKGDYPTPQVGWIIDQGGYTFTIDTVTDESNWRITYTGIPYGSGAGGTATLTNPNPPAIWKTVPLNTFKTAITGTYSNTNVASYLVANPQSGTYSNTNVAAYLTTGQNVTTANLTITGNVVQQGAYYETFSNVTNSGGNLVCNFANSATFYATLTANVTANIYNVTATAGRVTSVTLIVDQGATAYGVANIQINGGGVQTIKWAGGTGPNTGTASNTDVMSFSLISLNGTAWRVLGQISNYG